jgi:Ser/Thr protein kinase RdoA (MazF antagonist)
MRRILHHVKDEPLRDLVAGALEDFEARAVPGFAGLRSKVIHSDLNPENILVEQSDADAVAGVIDFGDMLHAPLIVDVAICASYLRATTGDPFCHIAEFLAGYHSVTRLTLAEIDLLPDLLRTRLAASIAILAWRESLRSADDLYLASVAAAESDAAAFLQILSAVPLDNARQTLRQVCASV